MIEMISRHGQFPLLVLATLLLGPLRIYAADSVTVTAPNGAEVYSSAQSVALKWTAVLTAPTTASIFLIQEGAVTQTLRLTDSAKTLAGANSYAWRVPPGLSGNKNRIQVQSVNGAVSDLSDGLFSIQNTVSNPTVTIVYPNKSERLRSGQTYELTWIYAGPFLSAPVLATVSLLNSLGVEVHRLSNGALTTNGINRFQWTVPSGLSGTDLKLRVLLPASLQYVGTPIDYSDGNNSIIDETPFQTLQVTTPNRSGERFTSTQTVTLEWTYSRGTGSETKLVTPSSTTIYLEKGPLYSPVQMIKITDAALTQVGTNRYSWKVPVGLTGTDYRLRVSASDGQSYLNDDSDNLFELKSTVVQPTVNVIWPNKGETLRSSEWTMPTTTELIWSYGGPPLMSPAKTILSLVNASSVEVLRISNSAQTINGINRFYWTLPAGISGDLKLKVLLVASPQYAGTPVDYSDATNRFIDSSPYQTLNVTTPNSIGERFTSTQTVTLEWTYSRGTGSETKLVTPSSTTIYLEKGPLYSPVQSMKITDAALTQVGTNRYSWKVPVGLTGTDYRLRVSASDGQSYLNDDSDNLFELKSTVVQPTVSVIWPNKGETLRSSEWTMPTTTELIWSYGGPPLMSPAKTILSLVNASSVEVLRISNSAQTINGINRFYWTIPAGISGDLKLKVLLAASPQYAGTPLDYSDATNRFIDSALYQTLSVTTPNSIGERFTSTEMVTLEWTYSRGTASETKLVTPSSTTIYLEKGPLYSPVQMIKITDAALTQVGTNRYSWKVPVGLTGTDYRLRVSASDGQSYLNDDSDNLFELKSTVVQPTVNVIWPNKGETLRSSEWTMPTTTELIWSYGGPPLMSPAKTILSLVNASSVEVLRISNSAQTINGINRFYWTIPAGISGDLKLKVLLVASPQYAGTPVDYSDATNRFIDSSPYQTLSVTTPNSIGERFTSTQTVTLEWTYSRGTGSETKLVTPSSTTIYLEKGPLYSPVQSMKITDAALTQVGTNRYSWKVPVGLTGTDYRLRVSASDGQSYLNDDSDNLFELKSTVVQPTVNVIWPNKGETLRSSDSVFTINTELIWSYGGPPLMSPVKTILSLVNASSVEVLRISNNAQTTNGVNRFYWTIPPGISGDLKLKVLLAASPQYAGTPLDYSDATNRFIDSALYQTLSVTTPNSIGERFTSTEMVTLEWTYSRGTASETKLVTPSSTTIYLEKGPLYSPVQMIKITDAALTQVGTNRYSWKVPVGLTGTDYRLRVQASDGQSYLNDDSDNLFELKSTVVQPTVSVIWPNKGETLRSGGLYQLVWSYGGSALTTPSNTVVSLINAAGAEVARISNNAPTINGVNTLSWRMPSGISGALKLKVSMTAPAVTGYSDAASTYIDLNPQALMVSAPLAVDLSTPIAPADTMGENSASELLQEGTQAAEGVEATPAASEPPSAVQLSGALHASRIYPNPWRGNRHGGTDVKFRNLTTDSTIKIFTIAGRHVRTLEAPSGSVDWNLRNDSGDNVASGLYLYLITNNAGEKHRGKLAVIR